MIEDKIVDAPEIFEIALPDEPPVGAVVLDRFGRAWQRQNHGPHGALWYVAGPLGLFGGSFGGDASHQDPVQQWGTLLLRRGPVELIHTPAPLDDIREDTK